LPAVAEARMAEIRASGTWGSALTSDEFAAIRSVGFAPAGQVLGACVYNIGYTGGYACPGSWGTFGYGSVTPYQTKTQVSSRGGYGSFAPLVQAMYEARHKALDRMTAECDELGGHGVVGVRLTIGPFPAGGLEFKAIGTAVRAPGVPPMASWNKLPSGRHRTPFTSDLSGQDFAKLIMKGWVPAGLALGISIGSRHDDWLTVGQTRWGSGNAEVIGYTELVNEARHDARLQLERDVTRLGGEGVVIAAMEMRVRERECPVQEGRRDHIVEATTIGTAIARFTRSEDGAQRHKTLAIMSLDPQRRQAARIRI
ncbi:MAG TPA: heavy metal-binding domain-containing protein, partial [Streptosporangiaceae bacterium]|nr:heavy metal-binding domain-containing protein [Streptosporangiaceae bacterium]